MRLQVSHSIPREPRRPPSHRARTCSKAFGAHKRMRAKALLTAGALLALLGTVPHHRNPLTGSFKIDVPPGPYVSGSRLPVSASGVTGRVSFSLVGPGELDGSSFVAPAVSQATTATIIASARGAVAVRKVHIVPAPAA